MIERSQCSHCEQPFEFESAEFAETSRDQKWIWGQTIPCPAGCGGNTTLRRAVPKLIVKKSANKSVAVFVGIIFAVIALVIGIFYLFRFDKELAQGICGILALAAGFGFSVYMTIKCLWTRLFAAVLFIAGLIMVVDGVWAQIQEKESAIRGTQNVCEFGLGFLVIAASFGLMSLHEFNQRQRAVAAQKRESV